jgi:serine/threonine-protein kinase
MSSFAPLRDGLEPYPGYRLQRPIGRGGFGEVWEAASPAGETLALKFIPAGDGSAATQEIRSIQNIRRLENPHLIRVEQVWCYAAYIVIAMEQADGSLLDVLHIYEDQFRTPVPVEEVVLHLAQAAEGLDFLNARQHVLSGQRVGFQHCDVKPSNLLLLGDTIKLCDFGLSSPTSATVRPHRRAGTMNFCAPEVFRGQLSNWTDQYALAVTYCQLRGGRVPFPNSPAKFDPSYTRPAPDLSMLPPEEQPILARALSVIPQQRWPSCIELIAQLARVAVLRPSPAGESVSDPSKLDEPSAVLCGPASVRPTPPAHRSMPRSIRSRQESLGSKDEI